MGTEGLQFFIPMPVLKHRPRDYVLMQMLSCVCVCVLLSAGVTFSDVVSATEPCKPCTECLGLQSMSAPCVEADDAVCRCSYGYYQDEETGRCEACSVCEVGSGLVFSCQDKQNTVCEECPEGTYSDEANHVDPCLPCTVCEDTERQLRECTPWADAECEGEHSSRLGQCGDAEVDS